MADMTFEEFAGGGGDAPAPARSLETSLRVDPEEQQRRDAFSQRLQANEEQLAAGGSSAFPATSSVVEGSQAQSAAEMSFEDFAGQPATGGASSQDWLAKGLTRLRNFGGEAATAIDFFLGIPGFVLGTTAGLGGAVIAGGQYLATGGSSGVNPAVDPRAVKDQFGSYTAYTAGREIGRDIAEPVNAIVQKLNPLRLLLDTVGEGKAIEESGLNKGMSYFMEKVDKLGRLVEEQSGGRVSRDAIPMLVETLMVAAPGVGGKGRPAISPLMQKTLREHAAKMREQAETELAEADAARLTPEETIARVPVQQQINDLLGIRSSAEQAKLTRQRRKDVQEAFKSPAKGSDYVDIAESQFRAEERLQNEARESTREAATEPAGSAYELGSSPQPEARVGQAEILRIMRKPGFERTAEDLLTLRKAQRGDATPEAMMLISAAGLGATAGALAGDFPDDVLKNATLGGLLGVGALLPFIGRGEMPKGKGPGKRQLGMFLPIGPESPQVKAAETASRRGVSRDRIWQEFGVFKGRDGVWRTEKSDLEASLEPGGLEPNQFDSALLAGPLLFKPKKLGDILRHEQLYREFPELKEAKVQSTGFNFNRKGAYDEQTNTFQLGGGRPEEVRNTLLHEIQHYVQGRGDMARGGNAGMFLDPKVKTEIEEVSSRINQLRSVPELKEFNLYVLRSAMAAEEAGKPLMKYEQEALDKFRKIDLPERHELGKLILRQRKLDELEGAAYDKYRRLAGEEEARATEKRSLMNFRQRRETPPWKSFDVPEEQFILSFKPGELAGSVKAPGGMWHPKAVERLRTAMSRWEDTPRNLAALREGDPAHVSAKALDDFARRSIKTYLNRYAGTEKDPLKDVEIPHRDATATWGRLWDFAIKPRKASDTQATRWGVPGMERVPAYEVVYDIHRQPSTNEIGHSRKSIESYLSHVGDYLRQNVPPEKLQQYDLVRAVRETNQNDLRMAKEMEKAAAASMKDLPVYKDYGDGFKWVELKLPEKLTEAQGKQVKFMSEKDIQKLTPQREEYQGGEAYVSVDAAGKPTENVYTGEWAVGKTPQEAWLAGRLAEEGNQMGHCVGGYCPSVASGESKIFSLRDSKGQSHVTVEVQPETVALGSRYFEPEVGHEVGPPVADNILQIKGKQNRAPAPAYLPYVQDFVKSGKWGEVRDLENTGLIDVSRSSPGLDAVPPSTFTQFIRERFGDQRFVTKEEHSKALADYDAQFNALGHPRGPRNQQGSVDQKLLMGAAVLGLGGIVGSALSDDPGSGALLGALAGGALMLPGTRARLARAVEGADFLAGNISTNIRNVSESLLLRARRFEMRTLDESHRLLHQTVPFMKAFNDLKGPKKDALAIALQNGDAPKIAELLKGSPALVAGFRQVRNVLKELGDQLGNYGRFKSMKEEYFPRLVKDFEGLKAALDQPVRTRLEQQLDTAEKAAMRSRGTPLTDIERSAIINRELQAVRRSQGFQPDFAKSRKIDELTSRLLPFYHTPAESLYAYIQGAVRDLEMAKFFGKDLVQTEKGGQTWINIDQSVGNLMGRELKEGKMDFQQAKKLEEILKDRFRGGERSANSLLQEMRNLGNMGLLGNLVSAATQGADALMAVYAQGFRATLTALARQFSGNKLVTARDFGLADHVAEEFVSGSHTATWLNKMFKYSGFSGIDRFGKTMQLSGALAKFERLSRTEKGVRELQREYGAAYGEEFPQLVADLRAGRLTERVRVALFSELSDMQPISKLELPQAYLRHPNGRLIYMLKTFMLKQMDVVRRDVWNELKKGNRTRALKNATSYALVLGLAGASTDAIKDWLMGRDPHFEAGDVLENALKTFGWSAYVREKAAGGRPVEAAVGMVAPPYRIMDEIIRRDPKAVQYIPIIGKLYYNWELGGREEAEIRDRRAARRKGIERDLSPRAEEYQERKREARRERREAQQ